MGALLPHQDAWMRARDRYTEDLTAEEKAMFNEASIEKVFYDASAAEKKHAACSKTRNLLSKLDPLVTAIEQYGEAIDVYSNAYPLALSPLWGSVRVVLHLARAFGKYFEILVDMFSSIGDILPRFRIFERLFSNHELLIQALSKVYVDIISFCTEAKRVFRDGQSAASSRIAFKLAWKPFERQFGGHIERFRQHRKNVEKEAGLAHMIEAADSRAVVLHNQMQLEADRQVNERLRLLEALSTVDYAAKHQKIQRARYDGTGGWLLENEAYRTWKEDNKPACLRCSGIPGCGKTFLASRVIDELLVVSNPTKLHVVYYYCDYADFRTLQAKHLFEAIMKQLIMQSLVPTEVERQLRQSVIDEARVPGEALLQRSILSAIESFPGLYVIIDGLDECEKEARRDAIALIEAILVHNKAAIKTFVSCREDEHILRSLDIYPCIDLSETMMTTDINAFITGTVRSMVKSGELKIVSPALEGEIVAELVTKAHGMFLWVYLQLEELCEAPSELIGEVLRDLPEGLAETYRRILFKLQKSAWKTKIAAKTFKWIACAQRPLQIDELKEAIEHEKSDTSWRNAASIDDEQLIRSFGALVCMDTEDRTIRFVHHTVLQFLFSTEDTSPTFHFSRAQAHRFVGEMCVVYLSFSDFETSLTHRPPERKFQDTAIFQAGAMSTIPNVLGVGRLLFRIVYRFMGGKQATTGPTIDHDRLLNTLHKPVQSIEPVSSILARKYRLLDYVVTYWDYHTKWLEEENMVTWRSFRDLALNKSLPFEFRKWGLNEHHGSYGCNSCEPGSSDNASQELPFTTLIHYAAQIGHVPLLRLFRDEARLDLGGYLAHEHSLLLLVACFNDQVDVVEYLLHGYAQYVDSLTFSEALHGAASWGRENTLCALIPYASKWRIYLSTALPDAIDQGNVSCAERLITAGARFDVSISEHQAALNAAMKGELDSTIAMLIQRDQLNVIDVHDMVDVCNIGHVCDVAPKDHSERVLTGLMLAASRGLTLTFNAMIHSGAPSDNMGYFRKTVLHYAAESGYSRAIRHLLEHGSDVNAYTPCEYRNVDRLTALHLAAMGGHTDAVQILCEYGATVDAESEVYAYTSLHLAARNGYPDTVRKLLEYGADSNREDPEGWTPLDHAIEYNKKDAETALREQGAIDRRGRRRSIEMILLTPPVKVSGEWMH